LRLHGQRAGVGMEREARTGWRSGREDGRMKLPVNRGGWLARKGERMRMIGFHGNPVDLWYNRHLFVPFDLSVIREAPARFRAGRHLLRAGRFPTCNLSDIQSNI
jgi:hypothetical protein